MTSKSKIVLAALVGATVGGAAIHGLHAQAKPKAYIVTESEIIDAAAAAAYGPRNQAAQKVAGGRSFRTTGKITAVVGTPPQRVGLSEWDNAEQAQAWTTSQARKDLNAERDKAIKIIRHISLRRSIAACKKRTGRSGQLRPGGLFIRRQLQVYSGSTASAISR